MATLSLFAITGILGLVVDLGWAYYVRKSAQAAADAASLAAARKALLDAPDLDSLSCTAGYASCTATPLPCPGVTGNLERACVYAAMNGFDALNPRQQVTVQASDWQTSPTVRGCTPEVSHPPTAPCVSTRYWVTVRVSQSVPQLFSAILGNTVMTVSARATAAVSPTQIEGQLILLNRENDPWIGATGADLAVGGTPTVKVPDGIILSSNVAGSRDSGAGTVDGMGIVDSSFTMIRTGGGIGGNHPEGWVGAKIQQGDGRIFTDPTASKHGQPPLNPRQHELPFVPVPGGVLNAAVCGGSVCGPGNYYATGAPAGCNGVCPVVATGERISINSDITFAGTSSGYSNFGDYVFFGGLHIGQARVDFGPGRYVMAGVKDSRDPLFDNDNASGLSGGSGTSGDPGRLLILTDSSYEGRLADTFNRLPDHPDWTTLGFGKTAIRAGNNASSFITLYGLNPENDDVQRAGLEDFAPAVLWQDQFNSVVKYARIGGQSTGQIDTSCGSLERPCYNEFSEAPQLEIWATPNTLLSGVIYQPRGAWTIIQASGIYRGQLQLISGALKVQGSGELLMASVSTPMMTDLVTLVE